MELIKAKEVAEQVMRRLSPYSDRLEIAGSIRRGKAEVSDIDLVVIPKTLPIIDMFGQVIDRRSMIDRKLLEGLGIVIKAGKRFAQVELWEGINLELSMILPPATWPVMMVIKTGPADFSHWIVTSRNKGGALPNGWRNEDGRVWDGQTEMKFEEELDFLKFLGLGWIEPKDRRPRWNYFRRPN